MSVMRRTLVQPRKARGTFDGDRRKIACSFQPDLFRRIGDEAAKNNRSFREQVAVLCEQSLEATKP